MERNALKLMLIGGPTLLIEWQGLRFLTDPTFDPAGGTYPIGPIVLTKTRGPAVGVDQVGKIDAVLLSHDHHQDNLDTAGRAYLTRAGQVLTTASGASRLGGNSIGLDPWASTHLETPDGGRVLITATPARHGPEGCEPVCGDVIGFVLQREGSPSAGAIYFSGDTVWYEGVAEVARQFPVTAAILCLGAARLAELGPDHLTMNAADAVQTGRAFGEATIIPVHHDGWAHWSEDRHILSQALEAAGLGNRVLWLDEGLWFRMR